MKKIFLHIGLHKTGSTAIQSALDGYDDGCTKYADLGYQNHSIPIYTAFSGRHTEYHIWKRSGLSDVEIERRRVDCLRRINRALSDRSAENIIVSGEDMSVLPRSGVVSLAETLGAHADVKVIVYVRHPASSIVSMLQERIKHGTNPVKPPSPSYRTKIENYIEVFGANNVIFRSFERADLIGGDVVEDFCASVGIAAPEKRSVANESLSDGAIRVIYKLNKIVSPFDQSAKLREARNRLVKHVSGLFSGKFTLPPELVSGCIDWDDVEWLYQASGIDFRSSAKERVEFSEGDFVAYMEKFTPDIRRGLSDYLKNECGIRHIPQDPKYLVARYFLTFVEGVAP